MRSVSCFAIIIVKFSEASKVICPMLNGPTILLNVLGLHIFPIFCLCLHGYLKHPAIIYLNLTVLISFLIY